jgi:hypothetical protein
MRKQRKQEVQIEKGEPAIECVTENGEPVIYVVFDGVRIAKRGHPDTPQAGKWVSLKPGFRVEDGEGGVLSGELIISCHDEVVH